jgi:hypothetical protein
MNDAYLKSVWKDMARNGLGGGATPRYSGCKGSARQLQVQIKFPNEPYAPRPQAVVVCSYLSFFLVDPVENWFYRSHI